MQTESLAPESEPGQIVPLDSLLGPTSFWVLLDLHEIRPCRHPDVGSTTEVCNLVEAWLLKPLTSNSVHEVPTLIVGGTHWRRTLVTESKQNPETT